MNRICLVFLVVLLFAFDKSLAQDEPKEYVFVFLNSNPDKEELPEEEAEALQKKHLDNLGVMVREGKLLVAGPFNGGGGILILNTNDTEEARKWILSDPAIRANRWHVEIFTWQPRKGSVCLVDESTRMVERTFVRYNPHITKFNVQQAPQLFLAHDNYLKKIRSVSSMISEGIFDNNDGGFAVFETPPERDLIFGDPTVVEGLIIPEIKTIWIAEGSFCEEL